MIGSNKVWCGISVMVPLPSPASEMPDVNSTTGIDDALVSAMPGTEYSAPAPLGHSQKPGRWASRA